MSSPSPGKRRMDTDVVKLIESKHEVTILSGLNEFVVKFYGPQGKSNCRNQHLRNRGRRSGSLIQLKLFNPRLWMLFEPGRFTLDSSDVLMCSVLWRFSMFGCAPFSLNNFPAFLQ